VEKCFIYLFTYLFLCYQKFGKFSQKIAKLVEFKTGKKKFQYFLKFSLSKNSKILLGKKKTDVEPETLILGTAWSQAF